MKNGVVIITYHPLLHRYFLLLRAPRWGFLPFSDTRLIVPLVLVMVTVVIMLPVYSHGTHGHGCVEPLLHALHPWPDLMCHSPNLLGLLQNLGYSRR